MKSLMYKTLLLIVGFVLTACDNVGFEEFGEISKLRVLAVRVDPPEIGPGETAVIDALVVGTDEPIGYRWEVCLFTDGPDEFYRCAEEDGQVLGAPLGADSIAVLPYDVVEEVIGDIDTICAELAEVELGDFVSLPGCDRGLSVTIRLSVQVGDGTGENLEVATAGLLLLNEEEASTGEANNRPLLDGLLINDATLSGALQEIPLVPDTMVRLQALVEPDRVAETYEETEDDGSSTETRERLQLTWFSSHGQIERTRTFFSDDDVSTAELQSNLLDLTAGTTEGVVGDTVELHLVLRDDRGSLDFLSQPFVIVEP